MRIAILAPIERRISPRTFGSRESTIALLTEGLVARGIEVTLFATADSETSALLHPVTPRGYAEDASFDPLVWESLHIRQAFAMADNFDLIHNHLGFNALTCAGLVTTPVLTTIHDLRPEVTLPVYRRLKTRPYYVSVSDADRSPELRYLATIYPGVDVASIPYDPIGNGYLLFFGRITATTGATEAIAIARGAGRRLVIAGVVEDPAYFERSIAPHLDGTSVDYLGDVDPERRNAIMGGAAALLHPVRSEPFSLTAVQANACGTPVIAFRHSGISEIITEGVNGFVVHTVKEAVDAVSRVEGLSRDACRKVVESRFTAERMVNEYLELYTRILEETKREDHRPWGYYQVLSDLPDHKVKRIVVYPGKRLSLQRHAHRAEHWTVISGTPVVTLNGTSLPITAGSSIEIPLGATHRIFNPGTVDAVLIEVQVGDYFGEDDIERFEDDYGRL